MKDKPLSGFMAAIQLRLLGPIIVAILATALTGITEPTAAAELPRQGADAGNALDRDKLVSFRNDVEPLLTKLGCNQGACHGAQHGKGGFKLSLLGFESEFDHTAIVKTAEGRRVTPFAPEESLLLLKPTLTVSHGGGKRIERGSDDYKLIVRWLEQGATAPKANDPRIVELRVTPGSLSTKLGHEQRLSVTARFDDGSTREVTSHARFDSLNEAVASVKPTGLVHVTGHGETNIMVRYQGMAAMSRMTVPYAVGTDFEFTPNNIIDLKAAAKWRELGLIPSPTCSDAEFLRRAMLDAIGTTPTPDEIDAFLTDRDPDKRSKLIDRILQRPEYVDYWNLRWGDVLRINSDKLGAQGMLAFNLWVKGALRENMPFNRMVEALVTAQGSIYSNGPANYFRVARTPDDLAETTAQVFMGVRLQCAKCHHHPFESYGQDDYYGLAAYFARVRTKASDEFGLFGGEQVVYVYKSGEVRQPRSGKTMVPRPLNDKPTDDPIDRRRALAKWLTAPSNPWLARNVANRYWGYLMGKGLVNPIDDLRETNPPTNPELLDALADSFVKSGYDLKSLLKLILNSRVYQLSSQSTAGNRLDTTFFTHYTIKRLSAEQLLDAMNQATGTFEKFPKLPIGTRAISVPDVNFFPDSAPQSYFLKTFGTPSRVIACECERSTDPTLSQSLGMMNGEIINRKLSQKDARLAKLLKNPKLTNETLVETLYLITFNRHPSTAEAASAESLLSEVPDRSQGAQDLLWGLMNSKEFLFNH